MNSKKWTFPKNERLSQKRHIDMLFQNGLSFVAFPLRVIYFPIDNVVGSPMVDAHLDSDVSMIVCIPKKKIKLAVDRNYIKRRVNESYRLRKYELINLFSDKDQKLLLAFIYLDKEISSFEKIDHAMSKVIHTLLKITE